MNWNIWMAVPDGLVIASAVHVPSLQEPTAMAVKAYLLHEYLSYCIGQSCTLWRSWQCRQSA